MGGPVQNRTLLATASPHTVLFHKATPMSIRPLRRPLAEENAASHADPTETATHRVARLLCQDPAQDWRLRDLADLVHLSISQLGRAFSQRFGMSPIQYLSHVRAHRLAELLVTTDLPIGVAMAQVGWHSRPRGTSVHRDCWGQPIRVSTRRNPASRPNMPVLRTVPGMIPVTPTQYPSSGGANRPVAGMASRVPAWARV